MSLSPNSNANGSRFDPSRGLAPSPASFHAMMNAPNGYPAFHGTFEPNQMLSPRLQSGQAQHLPPGSVSNLSDGQSPTSVGPSPLAQAQANNRHRTSVSSNGPFLQQMQSDATSPGSVVGAASLFGDSAGGSVPPASMTNPSTNQPETDDSAAKSKDGKPDAMPSWAELKTKAGKERKRLPLACIACRRKKIRCSGEKPACKHCLRSRIPCVYKVTTRKAAPRTDYMAMLDKRLKRMEERVIKIVPKEDQGRISTIGRAVVKPAIPGLPPKPANEKKRGASSAFPEDLGEWSRSRPGVPRKPTVPGDPVARADESDDNRLLQEGAESLPSKELQLHLAEVYFDFVYGQSYHLLHKPSFIRKLEAGQVPPVLILAVCAISARFSNHPDVRTDPVFLRGEVWASAAREIALKRYDAPNITILIVYLILGLHEFGTCQGGRSWMLGGMAQRMAYALQLHQDLDHDTNGGTSGNKTQLSFTDREIRRRTMWACFMMDRFNSSGTERPIFVNEQFIQSQLPIKEHYFQFEIPGTTETLDHVAPNHTDPDTGQAINPKDNMGVAAYQIRLVAIWGQLIRYLNLGGKERDSLPMWSEDSGFFKLRNSIKQWKSSLPSSLTWTMENLQTHASDKIANHFIFLHIIHNQIVLFLNRFALPSPGSRSSNVKDMPQAFVTDCGRKALEAANQISVLVNEAMDHRVVAPFAGYCAFFSSTVHIYGVFSKNPALEASAKQNLAINVKYLTKMKKHWGMFHWVTENLKELYRKHADAALRGPQPSHTPTGHKTQETIFQYGDWFDRYPNGVSGTDYEEPMVEVKKEPGADAVLGQRSDLQSVEEFFSKLGPPTRTAQQKKAARKKRTKSEVQAAASNANNQNAAQSAPSIETPQQQHEIATSVPSTMPQTLQRQASFNSTQQQQQHSFDTSRSLDLSTLHRHQQHPSQQQHLQAHQQLLQQNQQQQQQQHQQHFPNLVSQTDLTSPYTNIQQQNFNSLSNNANNAFNLDIDAFNFGNNSDGASGLWDQGSAWFMPFNMEPPTIPDDGGLFPGDNTGFDMTGIFGDFGGLGAGLGGDFVPSGDVGTQDFGHGGRSEGQH